MNAAWFTRLRRATLAVMLLAQLGAASQADVRQLWKGSFHRSVPESWTGPIELYVRYESESDPPQKLDGILMWPTLGKARIRVEGSHFADGSIEFTEKKCLDGDCSQFIPGSRHRLVLRKSVGVLDGRAESRVGVRGKYSLHLE